MRILITGGAGYIGTALIPKLIEEKSVDEIIVYDNLYRKNYNLFIGQTKHNKKVRFVNGDILDTRKLKKEIENSDILVHLAAKVTTPFADHSPHEFDQINTWGTAELTYLVEKSNVQKLIYASSVSVYGSSNLECDLDTVLNPRSFYGISKMHAEQYVSRLANTNKTYVLRLGNVYGYSPSMRIDSVINKFMFEANFENRIRLFGNGTQRRSFIYIDRLIDILVNIILEDKIQSGTYNLVENTWSINEIVDELRKLYQNLELIFVNQNMEMRSLKVKPDELLADFFQSGSDRFLEDLKELKTKFHF